MKIGIYKQISLIMTLIFSVSALAAQNNPGKSSPPLRLIGNVKKSAEGCGCYFRSVKEDKNSERYVFFEDASEHAPLMNIDGRNVKLRLINSTELSGGVERKGGRFSRSYASGAIRIRLDFVAVSVCPAPYNPECVASRYEITLIVNKASRRQKIKAVGGCGC
jgi:hypothetical protein